MSNGIEEGKVRFFFVNEDYNTYLMGLDSKISPSKKDGKERPSVSVGIKLNGHNYIIPITSQYDSKWNNQVTFKIKDEDDNNKVISCLKINNMHPTLESQLTYVEFEKQGEDYKRLLYKEYDYIKKNLESIVKKAKKAHSQVVVKEQDFFKGLCVDYVKLESEYANFGKSPIPVLN